MKLKKEQIGKVSDKLRHHFRVMGQQTVYAVLLMVYAYRKKDSPSWAKRIILGTMGYVLMPFDGIPDISPVVGYTDDLGVLTFGLVAIASHINDDVRIQARRQLNSLFGSIDLDQLKPIDEKL